VASPLVGGRANARGALVVMAADKKKGLDSAEQRAKLAKAARLTNRTRRSAVNTRIKKVIKLAEEFKAKIEVISSEEDVKPLEQLISEAYKEIDKAVNRNILHKNNAARKKARIARYKRSVLIQAGLYTPVAGEPAFSA
jgi:small subunit ribosomal protein S20